MAFRTLLDPTQTHLDFVTSRFNSSPVPATLLIRQDFDQDPSLFQAPNRPFSTNSTKYIFDKNIVRTPKIAAQASILAVLTPKMA